MKSKSFLLISLILISQHNFSLERIQSQSIDRSRVAKLYIAPGLASVLRVPCLIKEVIVGNSDLIDARVSDKDPQSIVLSLASGAKTATNLIVKCVSSRAPFVFDVISSRQFHQDYVDVASGFGGPRLAANDLKLIESSEKPQQQSKRREVDSYDVKKKQLIKTYTIKGN